LTGLTAIDHAANPPAHSRLSGRALHWGLVSIRSLSPSISSMSDPYFQQLFAQRIGGANYGKGSEIYKFEKIKRAKRKALAEHPERKLVDFGIGENDEMAPVPVREALKRVAAAEYDLMNLDSTLILSAPKIGPHAAAIRSHIAELCGIPADCVGLKAKTPEGLSTGNTAIAQVAVLLQRKS